MIQMNSLLVEDSWRVLTEYDDVIDTFAECKARQKQL